MQHSEQEYPAYDCLFLRIALANSKHSMHLLYFHLPSQCLKATHKMTAMAPTNDYDIDLQRKQECHREYGQRIYAQTECTTEIIRRRLWLDSYTAHAIILHHTAYGV
ncbi:hypothetical protein Tcan_00970, partial [Toxocara canis]